MTSVWAFQWGTAALKLQDLGQSEKNITKRFADLTSEQGGTVRFSFLFFGCVWKIDGCLHSVHSCYYTTSTSRRLRRVSSLNNVHIGRRGDLPRKALSIELVSHTAKAVACEILTQVAFVIVS